MIVIPAIDLKNRQCVRLYQGKFDAVSVYSQQPEKLAQAYASQGASIIHVVDLDGAKEGEPKQVDLILKIKQMAGVMIQAAGGIRSEAQLHELFNQGIDRAVVGSLAISNQQLVKTWLSKFGCEKIVLALDCVCDEQNRPYLVKHGWQDQTNICLWDLIDDYYDQGLRHILCTDVKCDGTLQGPNTALYQECLARYPNLQLQASGGVSSLIDLERLKQHKVPAVIIGKALLEKRFSLQEALAC